MIITPEEIMAYVDGESDAPARARIARAALADPDVAARIAQERALRARLVSHYATDVVEDVPPAWVEAIRAAAGANVVPLFPPAGSPVAGGGAGSGWRSRAAIGVAIAASLILGIAIGGAWQTRDMTAPVVARNGGLYAGGSLADALDTQLAAAQEDDRIRMLATFRRSDGDICRTFVGAQASGIACRDPTGWQLQHILPGRPLAHASYRRAGSEGALMAIAQEMAVGDPFDAAQERQAKAKGWH